MANSVTARFNDDCKVFVSMSDDTTVEKAVIIDAEGNETDIGGGGSNFATVKINYTLPEGASIDSLQFNSGSAVNLDYGNIENVIVYAYGTIGLPTSELGTIPEIKIPLYEGCKSDLQNIQYFIEDLGTLMIDLNTSSVVSGDAEILTDDLYKFYVWGDCVLNLTLMGAD